jgi:hypothetical protein
MSGRAMASRPAGNQAIFFGGFSIKIGTELGAFLEE